MNKTANTAGHEFYLTANAVDQIKDRLNSSSDIFRPSFFATNEDDAYGALEALERLVYERKLQIAEAEVAIRTYRAAIRAGGPAALAAHYKMA
jgi:hypothetical protein